MLATQSIQNDPRQSFQLLKTRLHRQLVDALDLSRAAEMPEDQFRQHVRALAAWLCEQQDVKLPVEWRDRMVQELLDEIYGYGPIDPLMRDPDISDVLINGPDCVFVERHGRLERTDIRFANEDHLLQFIHRLVGRAGRRIDEVSPMVDAKLPDGSRLNAVIPPLALRGPTVSIRRFKRHGVELPDMVRLGTLAEPMAQFLIACVQGRINLVISGGTGAGKTTLLNNLVRWIPETERVVTIEQTAELNLPQADVVALETRPPNVEGKGEITQRDLVRNSLRMRPDRIIVGEARGGEVLDMLQAMNTGHDGSMSTIHANDTRDALDRMELMIALSGVVLPTLVARQYLASAIQILVHMARLSTGERKVLRISELTGCVDGAYQLEDVFVYRQTGLANQQQAAGAFYATGYQPRVMQRLLARGITLPSDLFVAREL
ncbi:MAG: type II/IV secretion system-related protein [Planctomycetaceae bacterium]|nr:MAG: type II/IV secretion system-related protein [Planctomycetaceae bacterium]